MINLPLSKEDLQLLERQDKHLNIVLEELKTIQTNHYKAIIQYNKQLQLKDIAKKVTSALKGQTLSEMTGRDMATLIDTIIQNNELFVNKQSVKTATQQRKDVINQTITKLNTVLNEYKFREMALPRPEQIPLTDKTIFTVDQANSKAAVVENNGWVSGIPYSRTNRSWLGRFVKWKSLTMFLGIF